MLGGHRHAEQPQLAHLGDQLLRHAVVVGDAVLRRHQALAHEPAHGRQQLVEGVGVERHGYSTTIVTQRSIGSRSWRDALTGTDGSS